MRSKWQYENDPTWLSDVEAQVATIIQRLLLLANSTIPVHISVDQIRRFKTLYSSIGLYCRYSSCKHRCVTYRSETELREHELTHVRSYKCMECDFAERPFTSRQDLRKHRVKYHMTSVDFTIPLQIRSLATKSIPPLRRKTQRLGIRESNVGLSPIDQAFPSDLRPTPSNQMIEVHQNTQTTREHAAMPKDLSLTDTSKRDGMETFSSAGPVSTSRAESGLADKLVFMDTQKAVHSPKVCPMSEAGFSFGEPIQKAPEPAHENSLEIDHVYESRHEPNTCNNDTYKQINGVHVENLTESSLRVFEDGHSTGEPEGSLRVEDGHSTGEPEGSLRVEDGDSTSEPEGSLRVEDGHSTRKPDPSSHRVYDDPSSYLTYDYPGSGQHQQTTESSNTSSQLQCLHPYCEYQTKRQYDLNRHQKTHVPSQNSDTWDCPGRGCGRIGKFGFDRKDSLREHLRKVHGKDIPKQSRREKK